MATTLVAPSSRAESPIEYPVAHYAHEDAASYAIWQRELRAFRNALRVEAPFPETNATSINGRDRQYLTEHDPRRLFFHNPLNFFSKPLMLSWIEAVDDTGSIRKVFVVSSNRSRDEDRRIVNYCIEGKRWRPALQRGQRVPAIRAVNIDYGETMFASAFWIKKTDQLVIAVAVLLAFAGIVVFGRFRRTGGPPAPL